MPSELKVIGDLQKNKKTVLFIPGNMCSPSVFQNLSLPPDVQGGIIDWANSSGPWDIETLGNRVNQCIEEKELEQVVVAGYSAGGAIALMSASEPGNRISGLLISNTGANTIGHGDPDFPQKIIDHWGKNELIEPFLNRCFSKPIDPLLKQETYRYIQELDKEPVYQAAFSLRQLDILPRLSAITSKVTIAHGIDDVSRTPRHAEELHEHIPHSRLKLLKGGHTIMVENKKEWENELHLLLAKV